MGTTALLTALLWSATACSDEGAGTEDPPADTAGADAARGEPGALPESISADDLDEDLADLHAAGQAFLPEAEAWAADHPTGLSGDGSVESDVVPDGVVASVSSDEGEAGFKLVDEDGGTLIYDDGTFLVLLEAAEEDVEPAIVTDVGHLHDAFAAWVEEHGDVPDFDTSVDGEVMMSEPPGSEEDLLDFKVPVTGTWGSLDARITSFGNAELDYVFDLHEYGHDIDVVLTPEGRSYYAPVPVED